jgi:hypothetical protein
VSFGSWSRWEDDPRRTRHPLGSRHRAERGSLVLVQGIASGRTTSLMRENSVRVLPYQLKGIYLPMLLMIAMLAS